MIAKTYFVGYSVGDKIHKAVYVGKDDENIKLLCDCGTHFTIKLTTKVKNNGNYMCRRCYAIRDSQNFDEDWGYKTALKRIRRDAKRSGREFDIDIDDFKFLSQQNCHYCNAEPSNILMYRGRNSFTLRHFTYSGLDRINNDMGYYLDNVVPCCFVCNRAKNSMSYKDFMDWLNKLTRYRSSLNEKEDF